MDLSEPHQKTEDNDKAPDLLAKQEPKPSIPLRQRRLPASFWQEPSMTTSHRETTPHSAALQSMLHRSTIHTPWSVNSATTIPPAVLPFQRFVGPSHFLMHHNSSPQWIRGSYFCTCASCLNYAHLIPRCVPEASPYSSLRYRVNVPCCSNLNCVDQSCKLCYTTSSDHPDRLRHLRWRAARYNAILD